MLTTRINLLVSGRMTENLSKTRFGGTIKKVAIGISKKKMQQHVAINDISFAYLVDKNNIAKFNST